MKMDWIAVLRILGEALAPLIKAYAESRKLAAQDGVTPAQLAEADARWTRNFKDPLADDVGGGSKPDEPTKPADPRPDPMPDLGKYGVVVNEHPKASDYPLGGVVYQYQDDSRWFVLQRGVGIGKPSTPPWHEVEFA